MPTGTSSSFQGTFEGNGHVIKNYVVTSPYAKHTAPTLNQYFYGLFGFLAMDSCEVNNLTVGDVTISVDTPVTGARQFVGGFVGRTHTTAISLNNICLYNISINIQTDEVLPDYIEAGKLAGRQSGALSEFKNILLYNVKINNPKNIPIRTAADGLVGLYENSSPITDYIEFEDVFKTAGTQSDPYVVSDSNQLDVLGKFINSKVNFGNVYFKFNIDKGSLDVSKLNVITDQTAPASTTAPAAGGTTAASTAPTSPETSDPAIIISSAVFAAVFMMIIIKTAKNKQHE